MPDWEELRLAGQQVKAATMARLDEHLERLEREVTARGGTVHWARDANEANAIVTDLVRATGEREVVKVKSMVTQEIGLNEALEAAGITALRDRPGRADRAARPRQAVAHPGAGDPPQPRRDPRDLPARDAGRGRAGRSPTTRAGWPMAARAHLRQKFLHREGRHQRRQLRASPRPARCWWSSPRATAGCA